MSFLFDESYYKIGKNGVSPAQNMCAYLGGSAIQTVGDNPVTAYRQLVQQYAKDVNGNTVAPKVAVGEANATFRANPIGASLSGLWPRLIGVLLKRVPKFGFLLGYSHFVGEGTPGFAAATCASICSAPFINPVRLVEKQQRAYFKQTGQAKPVGEILRESAAKNFLPLFRGTIPLMGHSLASAMLGLVGQPRLQKYVQKELGATGSLSGTATNLVASAVVSPIYVVVTNPLSRLEVIMQTNSLEGQEHWGCRGSERTGRGHGQVRAVGHLPRPGHRHRQGHRVADALPRGADLPHEPVQGVQPEEARLSVVCPPPPLVSPSHDVRNSPSTPARSVLPSTSREAPIKTQYGRRARSRVFVGTGYFRLRRMSFLSNRRTRLARHGKPGSFS